METFKTGKSFRPTATFVSIMTKRNVQDASSKWRLSAQLLKGCQYFPQLGSATGSVRFQGYEVGSFLTEKVSSEL